MVSRGYACQICQIRFNSINQFNDHYFGERHKDEVAKLFPVISEGGFLKFVRRPGVAHNLVGHCCVMCNQQFNSRKQFNDHIEGKFHRSKLVRTMRVTPGPRGKGLVVCMPAILSTNVRTA